MGDRTVVFGRVNAKTLPFDMMPMARTVPVSVLAVALGVADGDVSTAAALTARLCDALALSLKPRPSRVMVERS